MVPLDLFNLLHFEIDYFQTTHPPKRKFLLNLHFDLLKFKPGYKKKDQI